MEEAFYFAGIQSLFPKNVRDFLYAFMRSRVGVALGLNKILYDYLTGDPYIEPERNIVASNHFPNQNSVKGVAHYG